MESDGREQLRHEKMKKSETTQPTKEINLHLHNYNLITV